MTRPLAALALAFGLMSAPAGAFDLTAMSAAERDALRAEIRAYLLENPEVIMEAVAVLEQRQSEAAAQNDVDMVQMNTDALFNDASSWAGGNLQGDVTLVEFVDYRCGYCRKAHDEVAELVASDGNIRLILKEFPILGEQSLLASRFAIATRLASGDDAYKQVHDALIAFKGTIADETLGQIADDLALDGAAILARMADPAVDTVIAANHQLAQRLAISGTPTFVMPDRMLRGYLPLDAMRDVVREARAQ